MYKHTMLCSYTLMHTHTYTHMPTCTHVNTHLCSKTRTHTLMLPHVLTGFIFLDSALAALPFRTPHPFLPEPSSPLLWAMVPLRLSLPGTSSDSPPGLKALSTAPGTVLFVLSPITMPDMQQVFLRYLGHERMNDKSSKERAWGLVLAEEAAWNPLRTHLWGTWRQGSPPGGVLMSRRRALREPLVHCPCSGRGSTGPLPVPAAKGKAVPWSPECRSQLERWLQAIQAALSSHWLHAEGPAMGTG